MRQFVQNVKHFIIKMVSSSLSSAGKVDEWLARARNAIPQYERDDQRREWMYRWMVAFARRHGDVATTMIYTHVLNRPGLSVKSPLDGL